MSLTLVLSSSSDAIRLETAHGHTASVPTTDTYSWLLERLLSQALVNTKAKKGTTPPDWKLVLAEWCKQGEGGGFLPLPDAQSASAKKVLAQGKAAPTRSGGRTPRHVELPPPLF